MKHGHEMSSDKTRKETAEASEWVGRGIGLSSSGEVPKGHLLILKAFREAIYGLVRGGLMGFGIKGLLSCLVSLIRAKKDRKLEAIRLSLGMDSVRFGAFLGLFCGAFRGLVVLLTWATGKDRPSNSFIAAGVASSALFIDSRSRRKTISFYLFARSLDAVVHILVRKGVLPSIDWFYSVVFSIVNIPIMYGFVFMPSILGSGYYKWILAMGNITEAGMHNTLRERRNLYLRSGIKVPHRTCVEGGLHQESCSVSAIKDFFFGFGRSSKVYVPIHAASMLLMRHKALMADPFHVLKKTAAAAAKSCLFLTTYIFCIRFAVCSLRNLRKRDSGWHAIVAGLLTGLATLFESKSRTAELTLYCIPKALESALMFLEKQGVVKRIQNLEIALFSFAMAILCSARQSVFRASHFKALKFVLGV